MTDCLVCPALREQIAMLAAMLNSERAEKHEILKQLVNLADAGAMARLRGPQPAVPGVKRDVPIMSPYVARATLRDLPTQDEISRFGVDPKDVPAADRRDIEAKFSEPGS